MGGKSEKKWRTSEKKVTNFGGKSERKWRPSEKKVIKCDKKVTKSDILREKVKKSHNKWQTCKKNIKN